MSSTAITAINEATTIGLAETAVNQMMLMLGGIKNSDHNSHATVWTLKDGLTVESSRNGDNDLLYAKMYADGDLFSTTVFKGSLEDVASEVDSWCWGATQTELGTEAIDGVHHQLLVDWEDAYKDEAAGYVEDWTEDGIHEWYRDEYVPSLTFEKTECNDRWSYWPTESTVADVETVCIDGENDAVFPVDCDEWKQAALIAAAHPDNSTMLALVREAMLSSVGDGDWTDAVENAVDSEPMLMAWRATAFSLMVEDSEYEDLDAVEHEAEEHEDPYYGVDVDSLPGGHDWYPY